MGREAVAVAAAATVGAPALAVLIAEGVAADDTVEVKRGGG